MNTEKLFQNVGKKSSFSTIFFLKKKKHLIEEETLIINNDLVAFIPIPASRFLYVIIPSCLCFSRFSMG